MTWPIISCQVPVSDSCLSIFEQAVVTLPLRGQSAGSPIQVQASRGQASRTVPGLASAVTITKPQTSSPASPARNPKSPAVLQGVSSQNIIKQVHTALDSVYTRYTLDARYTETILFILTILDIRCWISTSDMNAFLAFRSPLLSSYAYSTLLLH